MWEGGWVVVRSQDKKDGERFATAGGLLYLEHNHNGDEDGDYDDHHHDGDNADGDNVDGDDSYGQFFVKALCSSCKYHAMALCSSSSSWW